MGSSPLPTTPPMIHVILSLRNQHRVFAKPGVGPRAADGPFTEQDNDEREFDFFFGVYSMRKFPTFLLRDDEGRIKNTLKASVHLK